MRGESLNPGGLTFYRRNLTTLFCTCRTQRQQKEDCKKNWAKTEEGVLVWPKGLEDLLGSGDGGDSDYVGNWLSPHLATHLSNLT